MKLPSKKKVSKQQARSPIGVYKKQQSYHYSAKRSSTDRAFDRDETLANDSGAIKKSSPLQALPSIFAGLLIVVSILYLTSLSTTPQLTAKGDTKLLREDTQIEQVTRDILSSSNANRTKITFDSQKVSQQLSEKYPEFSDVQIATPIFRHRPHITVNISPPAALLSNGSNVYVLNDQGRVLFDASKDKPRFDTSNLPLIQDQSSYQVGIGKPGLTRQQIAYVKEVAFQTEKSGLKVDTMTLVNGGGELDVRFGGLTYYVKFNFFEDARKGSGTFLATKDQLARDSVKPVEYIDVRIPERAYVK